VISHQGSAVKEMAAFLQKAKCILWFNKTKYVKRVQRRYRMTFGVNPPSTASVYAFYKHFCETGCLCKWKVTFAAECTDEREYKLDMYRVANITNIGTCGWQNKL
jgi:hypothetical protein